MEVGLLSRNVDREERGFCGAETGGISSGR